MRLEMMSRKILNRFQIQLLQMFPSFLRPGDPGDPDDKSLTTTVTGSGERLLVRATKTEAAQKAVAATTNCDGRYGQASRFGRRIEMQQRLMEKLLKRFKSKNMGVLLSKHLFGLAQKIMETATGLLLPKEPGLAAKSIKSVCKNGGSLASWMGNNLRLYQRHYGQHRCWIKCATDRRC